MFSKRTHWHFRLNRLTQALHKIRASGHEVLDLTESNPTRCLFQYPSEIVSALNNSQNLNYAPSPKGILRAREAVVAYYSEKGISLDPEQIFLTASTSEAYSFLFRLLLNPKEHLLIPRPSYPLFEYLSGLNDVVCDAYPLVYDEEWRIDLEGIKEIHPKTRAIVLVHPNNPTGSFVKREERTFLAQLAAENQLSFICDEVFLDYAYQKKESPVSTFAGENTVLTFTLSGISKMLGLPQMKLAWIVVNGPKELRDPAIERLEIIADTYLSVNTPSQEALSRWFSFRPVLQKQIQNRSRSNRNFLVEQCHKSPCELLHAEGGWYAILRLPETKSEEEWVLELLAKKLVLVHPGYFYDFNEGPRIVMSLLPPTDRFKEGVDSIFNLLK